MNLLPFSVRYDMNQDPYLLFTGQQHSSGPSLIALSPDGRTVGIAQESSIVICNSLTGEDKEVIENVHSGNRSSLPFPLSTLLLTVVKKPPLYVIH